MAEVNKQNEMIAETISVLRLKFPGVAQSFDAVVWPCLNPECTCNNATVRFCQPDINMDTIHFQLTVNLDTFELNSTQLNDSENDYPKIIYEFTSRLTDDDKKWILKGNKEARENANSNHANSNPHSFKSGAMAWYRYIFNTESKYHELTLYVDTKMIIIFHLNRINHRLKAQPQRSVGMTPPLRKR
jgi:lipopolysaccharide export LptBFGC system permease protein LptF